MSEPTLTEEDREALRDWYFGDQYDDQGLVAAVERIVARHRAEAWSEGERAGWMACFEHGEAMNPHITQGREDAR